MKWKESINFYIIFFSCLLTGKGYFQYSLLSKSRNYRVGGVGLTSLKADKKSYDVEAWRNGYTSCLLEVDEDLGLIFPDDINGTFVRNGPGNFLVGDREILHPFDGDGMIAAITIQNKKGIFRNRFVQTIDFMKERITRAVSKRGAFRTLKPGGIFTNLFDPKVKNVANTNIIYWNQKFMTLWEGGKPYFLNDKTLDTISMDEEDFNKQLKPTETFTAHPKIDPNTNTLIAFGTQSKLSSTTVRVFEFNQQSEIIYEREFEYPGLAICHDFVITKNYIVIALPTVKFELWPVLFGQKAPTECIQFQADQPSKLYLIPRNNGEEIECIDVDPHFSFHFANAHEDRDGCILIDSFRCEELRMGVPRDSNNRPISWKEFDYENEIPFPHLIRYKISKDPVSEAWKYSTRLLSQEQLDFGTLNPKYVGREYKYVYALCGSHPTKSTPLQGFVKVDILNGEEWKWMPEPFEFIGEMTFVPKSRSSTSPREELEEDDGYLMSLLFNGRTNRTSVVLFDAKKIEQGPILRHEITSTRLPIMLHGSYIPNLV